MESETVGPGSCSGSNVITESASTTSTARELLSAAVKKAELMCEMASLEKAHELDRLEEQLRWKRETLKIETQLAMFDAKINILESQRQSQRGSIISSHQSRAGSRSRVERWIHENEQGDSQSLRQQEPQQQQRQINQAEQQQSLQQQEPQQQQRQINQAEQQQSLQQRQRQLNQAEQQQWLQQQESLQQQQRHINQAEQQQSLQQQEPQQQQRQINQAEQQQSLQQRQRQLNQAEQQQWLQQQESLQQQQRHINQAEQQQSLQQQEPQQQQRQLNQAEQQQWLQQQESQQQQRQINQAEQQQSLQQRQRQLNQAEQQQSLQQQQPQINQAEQQQSLQQRQRQLNQAEQQQMLQQQKSLANYQQPIEPHSHQQAPERQHETAYQTRRQLEFARQHDIQHETPDQPKTAYQAIVAQGDDTNKSVYTNHNVNQQGMLDLVRHQGDLTKLLLQAQQKSTLPQRGIPVFDGNPLEYASWLSAFSHGIEAKTTNESERLSYLEHFTIGAPKALVRSCLHLSPDKGYLQAKTLLKNKYGNKYRIVEAVLKKVQEWPEIKANDGESLEKYSLFLNEVANNLSDLDIPNEMNHATNLKTVVSKLPYGMKDRWRNKVDYIEEEQGRAVIFKDFVSFMDKQSRIATNPVYGVTSSERDKVKTQAYNDKFAKKKGTCMATNVDEEKAQQFKKWCEYCEIDSHKLAVCRNFRKKPHPERIEFLKKCGVCFGCIKRAAHRYKDCTNKLSCETCKGRHATALHRDQNSQQDNQRTGSDNKTKTSPKENITANAEKSTQFCGFTGAGNSSARVQVVPVMVRSKESGIVVKTNAILDECSDATFLSERLKKKLKITGTKTRLTLQTITGQKDVESQSMLGLEVMDLNGENVIHLPKSYTCPSIPASTDHVLTNDDIKHWPYLTTRVKLPNPEGDVDLLIGNNTPKALEPWEIIHSEKDGPFASRTLLGWVVHGSSLQDSSSSVSVYRVKVDETMTQQLKDLYNTDFSERVIEDAPQKSVEDEQFVATVTDSIFQEDGHYVISLPLKDPAVTFPDNRPMAERRLASLKRKIVRNQEFHADYTAFMTDNLAKGYAEEVPATDVSRDDGKTWYLPHHGVYHPQKKKIRVVFDCAATYRGVSLNNELLQGPDLSNSLLGVILRFRQEPVALMADIQSMYHQVMVPIEDRDLLRFLWWPDGDVNKPVKLYRMKAHIFGAKSSPSCANFALKQTAKDNKSSYNEEAIKTLQHNFYVDDCLKSMKSETEAINLARELKSVCASGGFNLVKWVSNSRTVIESIPSEDRAKEVKMLDFESNLPTERALGILWSAEADKFGYNIVVKDKPPTRRGILSIVSSIYDPLGFVSPVVLPARKILQDLCKLQTSWDERIPENYEKSWNQWLESIPEIENFNQPRCFTPRHFGKPVTVQLHHFSDASETGYGTVTYLRFENQDREIHCSLVMGKSRVTPLKQVSVPRLELTAATISVRVNYMIHKELDLNINETFFWTDSTTVLQYIANEKSRFKTFVANRLAVIRDGSSQSQWHYVETWRNPADYSSRGQSVQKFLKNEMWIRGPEFLWSPEKEWPATNLSVKSLEGDPEVKVTSYAIQVDHEPEEDMIDRLFEHYSDWTRLKRATAWWLKLKQILLNKVRKKDPEKRRSLTAQDLQEAEYAIIRHVQKQSFPLEFSSLLKLQNAEANDTAPIHVKLKKTSTIANLDPELHGDLLRVGGRLRNAPIPVEAKHQLILPKNHLVSGLIIRHAHERVHHQGRNHVMAELRQRYWIVKANTEVRKLVKRCVFCRKYQAVVGTQKMADLPASRLQPEEPAFARTGVDYFGPLIVKAGRSTRKRYGVIFTCLASRAVHLEVAENLDTSSCIDALRRFMARRGPVKEIRSDNGTNFVGANAELKSAFKELDQEQIQKFSSNHGIKWVFNAPAASHHGGVWERQIRVVRKILQSILQTQYLKTCKREEQLHTFLCEVEYTINSRPLTRSSDDPNDLGVLTPNDLLLLRPNIVGPPGSFKETDVYAKGRWKQMQYLADIFWKRWLTEYIPDLQQRQKWLHPQRNLKEGDVVLVVENTAPRNTWSMGKVLQTFPDKRGHVRQALVKTRTVTLRRPVSKLCMLLEADK